MQLCIEIISFINNENESLLISLTMKMKVF